MDKQMMSMEELEQVTGGNIFTDAWDWLCEKLKKDDQPSMGVKPITKHYPHPGKVA